MRFRRRRPPPPGSLGDAVRDVAGCPCATHHEYFVAALAAAEELILRVTESSGGLSGSGGRHVVAEGEEIQAATTIAPNGRSFLLVFSDLEAGLARFPQASFVGVPPTAAFRMAVTNGNEGLVVSAVGADDVIVTADGLARLTAGG